MVNPPTSLLMASLHKLDIIPCSCRQSVEPKFHIMFLHLTALMKTLLKAAFGKSSAACTESCIKINIPRRLWDFVLAWVCKTGNVTVSSSHYAEGRTPLEILTGETPDITEYLDFSPYDCVIFKQNAGLGEPQIGRWLGVSHRVGPLMSYWVLPESGITISCTTVQPLSHLDKQKDENISHMSVFDGKIKRKFDV